MMVTATVKTACSADADTRLARLPNGMAVLVVKDSRFPLVSTRLFVHAGSAYETDDIAGISHLLEHMVFKGTKTRPAGEIARQVEAAGGYLNAFTSFDRTCYLTDMPAAHWKLGIDVVKDMAFHPRLDPKDLEMEKDVVIAELKRYKDSPMSNLGEAMQAATLQGSPYARPIIGFETTVRAITAERMRAYIKHLYQPQNMLLVVVGDIDEDAVLKEARRQFGGLKNTSEIAVPQKIRMDALSRGARVTMRPGPWSKVYLGLSFPTPPQRDMRNTVLDILAQLLTGDDASWLSRKYKYERQLVDAISASNQNFAGVSLFSIVITLDAKNLPEFWESFVQDLAVLHKAPFTEEDLQRAKVNIEDAFQRDRETLESMASWLGFLQFEMGGLEVGPNMLASYRSVSLDDARHAAATWLRPERLSVRGSYPKATASPDLESSLEKYWPAPQVKDMSAGAGRLPIETIDLEHGRRVVLLHDTTLPYTSLDMYFTGGDALLPPGRQGLASLTARVLTAGAGSYSAQDMEKYLSGRAASLSSTAGRQTFGISMRQPSRFNAELFPLLKTVLEQPTFAPEEVEREKKLQLASIARQNDQPLGLAFARLGGLLYPDHPYGYAPLGTAEGIATYSAEDVRAFWDMQVRQPWVLAVAGDFTKDEVLEFARSLPVPQEKPVELSSPVWGREKSLQLTLHGRNQAHLLLIFKTVPAVHDDVPALALLKEMLSGQSGLLFTELRDKQGLGYTVTAFNRMAPKSGYMAFYIGTAMDKLQQAKDGFKTVIHALQEKPLPASLLHSGRNQMEGEYYRERQTLSSRSSEAATLLTLGEPLTYSKDMIAKAGKLTPQDIQAIARKYLRVEDAYVLTVLPQ